jgi:pimeloyl-ACP methyl ester carboxylesterase
MTTPTSAATYTYDEFGLFHENIAEFGLDVANLPPVERVETVVKPAAADREARAVSALRWGTGEPELVLLHGGAQNAHTWDTVALALDRPLVAIDLPGHGHSDGYIAKSTDVDTSAAEVATAVRALAPDARAVVGMSLGGITALALATLAPDLVRSLVLVDVTPGVDEVKASAIMAFVNGPESFASFDDLLARTVEFNPTRTVSSLRRGILHNAVQREDGSWGWRHARHRQGAAATAAASVPSEPTASPESAGHPDFGSLWAAVSGLGVPLMLVRGMLPQSVVDDADEAELLRRCPGARVEHVEGAGHSVQGDKPVELAGLIADFVGG